MWSMKNFSNILVSLSLGIGFYFLFLIVVWKTEGSHVNSVMRKALLKKNFVCKFSVSHKTMRNKTVKFNPYQICLVLAMKYTIGWYSEQLPAQTSQAWFPRRMNVKNSLMFIVAENTGSVNISQWKKYVFKKQECPRWQQSPQKTDTHTQTVQQELSEDNEVRREATKYE